MSHISATHDHQHASNKGDLMNPEQSAGFVSDPLLAPITASNQPHPVPSDSTPSSDPSAFDASTHHPNTHYDHDKTLSKKKREKKLGVGGLHSSHVGGVNAGGRSFAEHDKAAHERAERRDHDLTQRAEEEGEDEDEDVHEDQEAVSHNSHLENRITGTEQKRGGAAPADAKPNATAGQKPAGAPHQEGDNSGSEGQGNVSIKEKVSGVLASAQEKASGMMDAVKQQPMVNSLLNKVGLGGGKVEGDSTKEVNAQAKKEEEA